LKNGMPLQPRFGGADFARSQESRMMQALRHYRDCDTAICPAIG
jgi:hypothetical protein